MNCDHNATQVGMDFIIDESHQMMLDQAMTEPLTSEEINSRQPGADPRYRGLNRAQRREAIAHERRAFKRRGGRR